MTLSSVQETETPSLRTILGQKILQHYVTPIHSDDRRFTITLFSVVAIHFLILHFVFCEPPIYLSTTQLLPLFRTLRYHQTFHATPCLNVGDLPKRYSDMLTATTIQYPRVRTKWVGAGCADDVHAAPGGSRLCFGKHRGMVRDACFHWIGLLLTNRYLIGTRRVSIMCK